MKKLLVILLLLSLFGCSTTSQERYEITEIETYLCDMSSYNNMSSTKHQFKGTTVAEFEKLVNEKGNGIFILSYNDCPYCKKIIQYINEIAEELSVTIYYIDAYSKKYPMVNTDYFDVFLNICNPILNVDEETNEKILETPMLFTIVNGEHYDHMIGGDLSDEPTETEINNLKKDIKKILLPFSKK